MSAHALIMGSAAALALVFARIAIDGVLLQRRARAELAWFFDGGSFDIRTSFRAGRTKLPSTDCAPRPSGSALNPFRLAYLMAADFFSRFTSGGGQQHDVASSNSSGANGAFQRPAARKCAATCLADGE